MLNSSDTFHNFETIIKIPNLLHQELTILLLIDGNLFGKLQLWPENSNLQVVTNQNVHNCHITLFMKIVMRFSFQAKEKTLEDVFCLIKRPSLPRFPYSSAIRHPHDSMEGRRSGSCWEHSKLFFSEFAYVTY